MTKPLTEELVAFCYGMTYDTLPKEVVERTKDLILDWLGVTLCGTTVPSSQTMATLNSGRTVTGHVRHPRGGWPGAELTRDEILDKAVELAGPVVGAAAVREAAKLGFDLENLSGIGDVTRILPVRSADAAQAGTV